MSWNLGDQEEASAGPDKEGAMSEGRLKQMPFLLGGLMTMWVRYGWEK
jgi:hypothetical protein